MTICPHLQGTDVHGESVRVIYRPARVPRSDTSVHQYPEYFIIQCRRESYKSYSGCSPIHLGGGFIHIQTNNFKFNFPLSFDFLFFCYVGMH
jgi:hypothetical protein